ncbi:MAG: hypothetical protein U1F65_02950 [Verrucomicrobiota bacterium]
MDHVTTMTVAGKSFRIVKEGLSRQKIVRRENIVTHTGSQAPQPQSRRQHLYLALAGRF